MVTSALDKRHQGLRRLYEAALKDRKPGVFFEDFNERLASGDLAPKDLSIRRLFEEFVDGGSEVVRSWDPRSGGGISLFENNAAVDTAAFSNITGQIVYNEFLKAFANEEFVFSQKVPTVSTQFNGERIAGIGNIGDMGETIGEGKPYPQAGLNEDWIDTPTTDKRGLIVPVTKEAIFFDRTGMVIQNAAEVGYALGIQKEKRLIDAVIDENTTKHRYKWKGTTYATFQTSTPWINKIASGNSLVDWNSVDTLEKKVDAILDPSTGEPVSVSLNSLIVTRDNLRNAQRILTSSGVQSITPGFATSANPIQTNWANPISGYSIVTSKLLKTRLASATRWMVADLGRLCRYMENWPITVVQAPSNSEAEFTQDIVFRFKASERGTPAIVEPRAIASSDA